MKRYHRRRTTWRGVTARPPMMVALHDTRFVTVLTLQLNTHQFLSYCLYPSTQHSLVSLLLSLPFNSTLIGFFVTVFTLQLNTHWFLCYCLYPSTQHSLVSLLLSLPFNSTLIGFFVTVFTLQLNTHWFLCYCLYPCT